MALGFMRRHKRWLYVFLWVVILGFVALYVPMLTSPDAGTPAETLAEVEGRAITAGEFQRIYLQQRQRLEQMYQGRMNPAALRSLHLEEQVLQELIDREIVRLEAARLGLSVDDAAVGHAISTAPQFQRDGQFVGGAELRRLAEMGGLPVEELEQMFRERLLRERLQALVGDVVTVGDAEAEREYRRRHEQVKLEYVQVSAASRRQGLEVSDAEIEARFQKDPALYQIPERRVVSYTLVDPEVLRARLTVTPADLEVYYRDHAEEYREAEQVCASHILIKTKATPDATEGHGPEEAKKLAEGLLQQARGGADFAALAKKSSEDQGSAPGGGDLGCFERGRMVPEFESAAFDLPVGQISDLVASSYGYHIIRVGAHKDETLPSLKQVEERVRQAVTAERLDTLQAEKSDAVAAALQKGRPLDQVATEQGLTIEKSAPFARGDVPSGLLSPAVVARAFQLKPGESDPQGVRVRRGQVFFQVAEVQAPRAPQLAEVKERIKSDLLDEKAFAAAHDQITALRPKADKDGLEAAAKAAGLVRKETPALVGRGQPLGELGSSAVLDAAAFELPEKTLSEPVRTPTGWALLRVLERTPFDAAAFAKEKATVAAQLRDERRERVFQAYMQQARQRYRIQRYPAVLRRVQG